MINIKPSSEDKSRKDKHLSYKGDFNLLFPYVFNNMFSKGRKE